MREGLQKPMGRRRAGATRPLNIGEACPGSWPGQGFHGPFGQGARPSTGLHWLPSLGEHE